MNCTRLDSSPDPAPLLHRFVCAECRVGLRADRMVGLAVRCLEADRPRAAGLDRVLRSLALSTYTPHHIRERSLRGWRRAVRRLGYAALVLFVSAQSWLWWIDRDPGVAIPTPRLPSPNAYAFFRAAGNTRANADEMDKVWSRLRKARWRMSAADVAHTRRLVEANAEALRLVRTGLLHEYHEPPIRSFRQALPHFGKYRSLGRDLALEAAAHAARGDIARANAAALDAMDMGMRVRKGSALIGMLVGVACAAEGRTSLWLRLDQMGAADARAVLARLRDIERRRVSVAETFAEERTAGLAGLLEFMSDAEWRWRADWLHAGEGDSVRNWRLFAMLLPYSKGRIAHTYIESMDRNIEAARTHPAGDAHLAEPQGGLDALNALLYPAYQGAVLRDAVDRVQTTLLRVAVAAQAYRHERGRWAPGLGALRDAGLLDGPVPDVFSARGDEVRYVVTGSRPTIYSVGPDGADQRGAPIKPLNARATTQVQHHSIGDIVAGVTVE
jgi:hypothetical protein